MMAIYVDDTSVWAASDSIGGLLDKVITVGIDSTLIQRDSKGFWYFDITPGQRKLLILIGACEKSHILNN